jgi:hypothetical protein
MIFQVLYFIYTQLELFNPNTLKCHFVALFSRYHIFTESSLSKAQIFSYATFQIKLDSKILYNFYSENITGDKDTD